MVRANRLSTFNEKANRNAGAQIDEWLKAFGGEIYTNCFSPGPDTARAIATFTTGLPPRLNGCDIRLKWPRFFLKKKLETVFDLFLNADYKLDILLFFNRSKLE